MFLLDADYAGRVHSFNTTQQGRVANLLWSGHLFTVTV